MISRLMTTIFTVTVIVVTPPPAFAEYDTPASLLGSGRELMPWPDGLSPGPSYQGETLSYWIRILQSPNERELAQAFEAIRYFGPDASAAVPALARIVARPFAPIHIGKDSDDLILTKLDDMDLHSEAIDTLAYIGEPASSATAALIDWAVVLKVIPAEVRSSTNEELFVDLITMDAGQRIQIALAIAEFGDGALPALVSVLNSSDRAKRKMAVALLGEEALTIAAQLLESRDCSDVQLGISMLADMEPVVGKNYIDELRKMFDCAALHKNLSK